MQGTGNEGFAGGRVANKGSAESGMVDLLDAIVVERLERVERALEWVEWALARAERARRGEHSQCVCNSIHDVGFTSGGITNVFAGSGGSGGPPEAVHDPITVVRIPCGIGNGARAGGGIANGLEGVGGSPGEDWSGTGGPPLGGGDGQSPSGGGGQSPFGGGGQSPSGGGGGPGGPPGEGVHGGGSYQLVRTNVSVDESEIVCTLKARGTAKRRIVRTSVKASPGKIRHTVRFKRVNSLQGQPEM